MSTHRVSSREYKIMLQAGRFDGNEAKLQQAAGEFWGDFRASLAGLGLGVEGELHEIGVRQIIRLFDTPGQRLYHHHYMFRNRMGVSVDSSGRMQGNPDKNEVTLKFRHPDRYVAQDRDMGSRQLPKPATKFEEDIQPSFHRDAPFFTHPQFSHSTSSKVAPDGVPTRLYELVKLFPGLTGAIDLPVADEALALVAGYAPLELVFVPTYLVLGSAEPMRPRCSLIVWYGDAENYQRQEPYKPDVVEFSFRLEEDEDKKNGKAKKNGKSEKNGNDEKNDKDKKNGNDENNGIERYAGEVTQQAGEILRGLQKFRWSDPHSQDKTSYVYTHAKIRAPKAP